MLEKNYNNQGLGKLTPHDVYVPDSNRNVSNGGYPQATKNQPSLSTNAELLWDLYMIQTQIKCGGTAHT